MGRYSVMWKTLLSSVVMACSFSVYGMVEFTHCSTSFETDMVRAYRKENGKDRLVNDICKVMELKLYDGFVVQFTDPTDQLTTKNDVIDAISTLAGTTTGKNLLEYLIVKLRLRRESLFYIQKTLERYVESVEKTTY